jgi:hypothetical protein
MKTIAIASFFITLSLFADPKPSEAQALGKRLMANFSKPLSIDTTYKERLEEREVPALRSGDWVITAHPISIVESFSKDTNTIVALFVRADDEFIRLSTTEKGEKPGTSLLRINPAYPYLKQEKSYTGKMVFSDEAYMATYDVIRDKTDKVVGAYLVAIPYKN